MIILFAYFTPMLQIYIGEEEMVRSDLFFAVNPIPRVQGYNETIYFDNNAALSAFCDFGDGTSLSPYLLKNLIIDASVAHGIALVNTTLHVKIQNCTIFNGGSDFYGISLDNCNHVKISNNTIQNCSRGIYILSSSLNIIEQNFLLANRRAGIFLLGSSINIIENNICANGVHDIYCENSGSNSFFNNTLKLSNQGLYIAYSVNCTIQDNTFLRCQDAGIMLTGEENLTITENTLTSCGLRFYNPKFNNFIDTTNQIDGKSIHYYEKQVGLCINNTNSIGQVILINCSFCTISDLDLAKIPLAISLWDSDYNTITNNTCSNNKDWGIRLENSDYNNITANLITFCSYTGIHIHSSDYNYFVNNTFYRNYFPILINDGYNLYFDSNGYGNYWGTYMIKNPNATHDGLFWDTSYYVDPSNDFIDNHPLVLDTPPLWFNSISFMSTPTYDSLPFLTFPGGYLPYLLQLGAIDEFGIDCYWTNDTRFQVDSEGKMTTEYNLTIGTYTLMVYVNDTSGQITSSILSLKITENFDFRRSTENSTQTSSNFRISGFSFIVMVYSISLTLLILNIVIKRRYPNKISNSSFANFKI